MTSSLRLTRAIVERDGAGYVEFRLQSKAVPTEAELRDDQVIYVIFLSAASFSHPHVMACV